jgi:hypothetical protein
MSWKGDKTDCSNYRGIPLLSTSYKIASNTLLSKLSPYVDEIIGDNQCGFRRNRSITDNIFLYSSDTGEKSGIQLDGTSAIHKLLERGNYCTVFSQGSGHPWQQLG